MDAAATVRVTEFELSDADAIEHFLVEAYGTSMRIRAGDDDRHVLRHRRTDAGTLAVETAYQSADLSFAVEPLRKVVVTRTSTSRLDRASDSAGRRYDAGELFLMSYPDLPYTARWMPGEICNCLIDPALLDRVAASAPGRRPEPIRFTSLDPATPALAAQWQAARSYAAGVLDSAEAATPLVIAAAGQLLAAATLAAFPNTAFTDPTIEDRHDAHPDTLRRAITFIDDNAHRDITVADIAAAAFVTIRAVQLAFRRHLDMTPLAYLRRVRLEHAHEDLKEGNPATTTVTAVAYRWGFGSASQFSTVYRHAYGVTPGNTLHHG